jgi:hypothetical protein
MANNSKTDAAVLTAEPSHDTEDALDLHSLLSGGADEALGEHGADDDDLDNEDLDAEGGDDGQAAAAQQDEELDDDSAEQGEGKKDEGDEPETDDPADALDEEGRKARASFTPAQQRIFDRELAKVKRKDREARETLEQSMQERERELTTLREQLEAAQAAAPAAPVAATAEQPLAGVDDEAALEQRLDQARALRRWALRHPQGGVILDDKGNEIEISEDRAASMLAESEDILEKHGPKRREFLQARAAAKQQEVTIYPWLKDPKSPGTVLIEGALKRHPVLRELFPDARLLLADMLVGQAVRQQAQAKNGQKGNGTAAPLPAKAAPKTTAKAPASPAGGTRPPKVAAAPKRRQQAEHSLVETGEDPDNAALGALLAG